MGTISLNNMKLPLFSVCTFVLQLTLFTTLPIKSLPRALEPGDSLKNQQKDTVLISKNALFPESVKNTEFNQGYINDPIQLIQGKMAGLSIVKPGNNPNEEFDIRIRGLNSVNGATRPMIVVDGMMNASFENYDPEDIESFEVLKNCSETAFYGIQGSNGVILVHTKKGSEGTQIEYREYTNVENIMREQKVLTVNEWRNFNNLLPDHPGTDLLNNTNWQDEITRTAYSQVHHLSVSGANHYSRYYTSVNYRGVQGVMINTGFKQINGLVNFQQKALKDKLTATFGFGGTYKVSRYGFDDAILQAAIFNPTAPVRVDKNTELPQGYNIEDFKLWNGYFNQEYFNYYNPVQMLRENLNDGKDIRYQFSGNLRYELFTGLNLNAFYGLNNGNFWSGKYFASTSFYSGFYSGGLADQNFSQSLTKSFEPYLTWHNIEGNKLKISTRIGYSYLEFINQGFHVSGGNFLTDFFNYNNLGASKDFSDGTGTIESFKNSNRIIGFYGSADFAWKETFFLSAVSSYDGSSRFGVNHKWGYFPGINIGIDLARFVSSRNSNSLKLNAGFGKTGNNLPASNMSENLFSYYGTIYYNGNYIPAYYLDQNENRNLKWESKKEFNFGLDYLLMGQKIYGSLDYYTNTTEGILQHFFGSTYPGISLDYWANNGELKNSGFEFSFNWKAVKTIFFTYSLGINYCRYFKNEIVKLPYTYLGPSNYPYYYLDNGRYPGTLVIKVEDGKPVGQFIGYKTNGVGKDGFWNFDVIGDNGPIQTIIGNGIPKSAIGISSDLRYKNWEVNIFFRGMFGHDIVNLYKAFYEHPQLISEFNLPKSTRNLKNPETGVYLQDYGGSLNSHYVEKGNYLKLDNFQVSYDLSFKKAGIKEFKVFVAGNNLFVITRYSGPDPEVRYQSGGQVLVPGVDSPYTWPMTRSFSLGIKMKLD